LDFGNANPAYVTRLAPITIGLEIPRQNHLSCIDDRPIDPPSQTRSECLGKALGVLFASALRTKPRWDPGSQGADAADLSLVLCARGTSPEGAKNSMPKVPGKSYVNNSYHSPMAGFFGIRGTPGWATGIFGWRFLPDSIVFRRVAKDRLSLFFITLFRHLPTFVP
jgi:hypothetical protein